MNFNFRHENETLNRQTFDEDFSRSKFDLLTSQDISNLETPFSYTSLSNGLIKVFSDFEKAEDVITPDNKAMLHLCLLDLKKITESLIQSKQRFLDQSKVSILKVLDQTGQLKNSLSFKNLRLLSLSALVIIACLSSEDGNPKNGELLSAPVRPTPTLSALDLYIQRVEEDNVKRVESFTQAAIKDGSPDYSGLGYESCTVDSDCLAGEQTCKAGIIPSSSSMPGYCVPK